ncbi:MAG: aspartyl protease family protein [Tepidiformaceae bacterium]
MTTDSEVRYTKGPERQMGHVFADILITNRRDRILADAGVIAEAAVRSLDLRGVLVDTGASHLALPGRLITQLGLELADTVQVSTADGPRSSRLFTDAHLVVDGRVDSFGCIELPDNAEPLLGVIPLETLGLEPDLTNRRLRQLPRSGRGTHLLLY